MSNTKETANEFTSIEEIARLNSVDKQQHGYIPVYSQLFEPIRFSQLSILEIGFRRGRGARFLAEYFHRSRINCLEIDTGFSQAYLDIMPDDIKNRIRLWQCDQSDQASLDLALAYIQGNKYYTPFDIVIDDGSHVPAHQLLSFKTIWPLLPSGAYYVIEDMHPFYENGAHPTVEYFKGEADKLNKMGDIYETDKKWGDSEFEFIMFTLNRIIVRRKINAQK